LQLILGLAAIFVLAAACIFVAA